MKYDNRRETRTRLLNEIDELRGPDKKSFKDDATRAMIDAKLDEIEALDGVDGGQIRSMVKTAGLESAFADELIDDNVTVERARSMVFDRLAQRSDAMPTDGRLGYGQPDSQTARMAEALAARFGGPPPTSGAREFMHMRAVDMARHCLEQRGVPTRMLSANQIVLRAITTTSSDFPELLTATGNRLLRNGYDSYQGGVRRICRESTAPDFRAKSKLQLGEAPELLLVGEAGEVTHGAMVESKTSYSLATYARIFNLSRQALVNDDLGAFGELAGRLGRAAAEFIAAQLATKLTSNPVMAYDSVTLFHADHGNLGTTGAISITTLTEALRLMRLQKGLDGVTPIDVTPKYLVVPAALEVLARQYVAQINAQTTSAVNPFSAQLDVVVDPRMDAVSVTAWYLAADPNAIDTIEYSFLEGEPGPQIETRAGFDVEGVEMKVRLDFGSAALDHRGLFKNAGA